MATLIVGVMSLPPVRRAGRSPALFITYLFTDFIQPICHHNSDNHRQVGREAIFAGASATLSLGNWDRYGDRALRIFQRPKAYWCPVQPQRRVTLEGSTVFKRVNIRQANVILNVKMT